jgi:hypothetical protein
MKSTLSETLRSNDLCLSRNPNGSDKEFPKRYISEIYEPLIGDKKNEYIKFLEIGVRTGASVELWSKYFTNLQFIGIDNGDDVVWQNEDWVSGRNIQYLEADAYSHITLKSLPTDLDVIVDDGPHSLVSQIWAAKYYSQILAVEGFLFIEDIQGGRRYCDRIIRSLPKSFKGCARIFDLRESSGEGDAIVVLIHNCQQICRSSQLPKNELKLIPSVIRFTRYEDLKYLRKRIFLKFKYKLLKLAN